MFYDWAEMALKSNHFVAFEQVITFHRGFNVNRVFQKKHNLHKMLSRFETTLMLMTIVGSNTWIRSPAGQVSWNPVRRRMLKKKNKIRSQNDEIHMKILNRK